MTVLVVYGSKRGGTKGIAESIGAALRDTGRAALVEPAAAVRRVRDVEGVEAVVVAGGIYSRHWHSDARKFVARNRGDLSGLPVWLVASGPLDDSADDGALPAVPQVAATASSIHARGTVTFGGYLAPDAKGFPVSAMARTRAGDWRNENRIRAWATEVHDELAGA
jgi:menaquinone-dependent protoporphyrinogen oxidase